MPSCCAGERCKFPSLGRLYGGRAAKPLKNKQVADKSRNRNSKDTRTLLLRGWTELAFEEGVSAICEGCYWKSIGSLSL